ncbi:GNAT family N-acetyltransferase [Haloimpatiens sp. FM7330]|uniref:GNAT family N-acetyltransferase n=1 Tax=Haloimpatiens sp. FM7330 TaxID=3298610 RepID=UPI003638BADD
MMFDLDLKIRDICINSIEKDDLNSIHEWINTQKSFLDKKNKPFSLKDVYEMFLQYYVGEGELFLKIEQCSEIIGIIKGRIEFKNPNEIWILCFFLEEPKRSKGIGSDIINEIMEYFICRCGINKFYSITLPKNKEYLKFWLKNGFEVSRITNNFINIERWDEKLFILSNEK